MGESFADMVNRCHYKVKKHMGWDDDKTDLWFKTINIHCGNITPDDFMLCRPDKFERWIDSMIDEGKNQ